MGILTRCITAISGFVMVLLLTGCWDRVEVNDLTLVMAAGLDKKGDKISLSRYSFLSLPAVGVVAVAVEEANPARERAALPPRLSSERRRE